MLVRGQRCAEAGFGVYVEGQANSHRESRMTARMRGVCMTHITIMRQ